MLQSFAGTFVVEENAIQEDKVLLDNVACSVVSLVEAIEKVYDEKTAQIAEAQHKKPDSSRILARKTIV